MVLTHPYMPLHDAVMCRSYAGHLLKTPFQMCAPYGLLTVCGVYVPDEVADVSTPALTLTTIVERAVGEKCPWVCRVRSDFFRSFRSGNTKIFFFGWFCD